jgi:phosphatidate cytidylyltransferase
MFGSYFLSIIGVFIFLENNILIFNFVFSLNVLIFIIFISTISQIGDITISYFKRLNNFKDTGNLIPGHGGILDRVDGLIFAYPFAFLVLKFNLINLIK